MNRLPSASELDRVLRCEASHVLPHATFTTPDGERGTAVHRFLHHAAVEGRDAALAAMATDDPARGACDEIDLDALPRGGDREVSFAYNWRTGQGRILGRGLERRYEAAGLSPDEYPGTADYAGAQGDCAVVVDYKTGRPLPARDSMQVGLLVLGACAAYGCRTGRGAHLVFREGQRPYWDVVEYDQMRLDEVRHQLAELAVRLETLREAQSLGLSLNVNQGSWCRYCPAFSRCPSKTALAASMLPAMEAIDGKFQALSVGDLAQVIVRLERYDAIRDRVWEFLDAYARRGGEVPLPDGRVYRLAPGRSMDAVEAPHAALRAIAEVCGEKYAERAMQTTKKLVEAAARDWAKDTGRKIGEAKEAVVEAARTRGAIVLRPGKVEPRIVREDGEEE